MRTPNSAEIKLKKWAKELLQEQRIALLDKMPFLGHLALQLELVPVIDQDLPVAATDGRHLFVNPKVLSMPEKFFSLQDNEHFGHGKHPCRETDIGMNIIAHEVWHCALQHFARRGERDAVLFNYACDVEVGFILEAQKMSNLSDAYGERALLGMPAEEIYELLQLPRPTWSFLYRVRKCKYLSDDKAKNKPSEWEQIKGEMADDNSQDTMGEDRIDNSHKTNQGSSSEISDGHYPLIRVTKKKRNQNRSRNEGVKDPDFCPEQCCDDNDKELQKQWRKLVRECAAQDKAWLAKWGDMPGNLSKMLENTGKPTQNWKRLLLEYVSLTLKGEYQWLPPNRRFIHQGLYLPGRARSKEIDIVLACDTSGSTTELLPSFIAELRGMVACFGRYSLTIIQCDASIHAVNTYTNDIPIPNNKVQFIGFGGTDLRPPFDYVRTHQMTPKIFIYLTDGCGPAPDTAPQYPVIWGLVGPGTRVPASWGKKVFIPQSMK